jgi:hypothetical protein
MHCATLLSDGRVLVAGGEGNSGSTASAELYDPETGTFSATGSMATVRGWPSATLLSGGRVLVVGGPGDCTASGCKDLDSAELYDPKTGAFVPTGSMTWARTRAMATLLSDGRVLIAGGVGGTSGLASAEIYSPATGSFSPTGSMATVRESGPTATLLPDGRVLIAGGYQGNTGIASAEIYTP